MKNQTLVVIPARIGSTRLSNKPLKKIGDITMIERVALQVIKSGLKNVYVATDDLDIVQVLQIHNIPTIMTTSDLPSGTDRVYEAWQKLANKDDYKYIINVQGDMPFIEPDIIEGVAENLWAKDYDIMTPVIEVSPAEADSSANVKVVTTNDGAALYFSRNMIPYEAKSYLYHIGVYGYKADSLAKYVKLPPSGLEITERLEQLRALQNGMSIGVCSANSIPISVDTEEDYIKALEHLSSTSVN